MYIIRDEVKIKLTENRNHLNSFIEGERVGRQDGEPQHGGEGF